MKLKYLYIAVTLLSICSCDEFLDIQPVGKIIAETGAEYRALLTDVYSRIPEDRGLTTLRTDELAADNNSFKSLDFDSYYEIWNWTDYNRTPSSLYFGWRRYYHSCYIANYLIEHKNSIKKASKDEIEQMVGESYMIRAYMHFLLANLYAPAYTKCSPADTRGIPLQLAADVNAVLKCSSLKKVYRQILEDIDSAAVYLNVDRWEEGYTYRFSTVTAHALKSRVALYMGDWSTAFMEAKKVIEAYPALEDLRTSTILPTNYKSVESIMALEQVITPVLMGVGHANPELMKSYRSGDKRQKLYFTPMNLTRWVYRERNSSEERCTFRAGEFYLIAAEAANELGNSEDALKYIKALMEKRYTSDKYNEYSASLDTLDQSALRKEIAEERRRELACQGHRWFDLRRTTQQEIIKTFELDGVEETFVLSEGDERYTLHFPSEAVEANPEIENWN